MDFRIAAVVGAAAVSFATTFSVEAADLPSRQAAPVFVAAPPAFTWSGAYIGAFLGGGSGTSDFRDPRGPSIYGDTVRTPFVEGGGQIGYNFQVPASRLVLGVEADGGAVGLTGTNTCLAYSNVVIPDNCRVDDTAMATGTGRVGYAFGAEGRTLAYIKGGVAALFGEQDIAANNTFFAGRPSAVFEDRPQVGFTVGAGLEQALSNAWSLKIEYDFADFGSRAIATPRTGEHVDGAYTTVAGGTTSVQQSIHELKVGLNYHFGAAPDAASLSSELFAGALAPVAAIAAPPTYARGYRVEAGGRYWYSFGRFQKDLAFANQPNNVLQSRLAYSDDSSSGEIFGRIDTPARLFVKGFVGAGGEMSGQHNDEDFRITSKNFPVPYSNTVSGQTGTLDYATVDIGYAFLETAATNVGGFVGYNYYKENQDGLGCQQIAAIHGDCLGAAARPTTILGISEDDQYNSVRLGVNGDMRFDRLRLQADAAYLPFVGFQGVDDHLFRSGSPSPEFGRGQGVQLELIATYDLTPRLSVGVGGRYWSMWIPDARTNDFGTGVIRPLPVVTERYGVTAQAAYRFSSFTPDTVVAKY